MECNICSENYDQRSNKPRNLLCGHTFCSSCCGHLIRSRSIFCPKCRTATPVQDVNNLPVNYPLLDLLESTNSNVTITASVKKDECPFPDYQKKEQISPHGGKCLEAQAEVAMHCAQCDLWLCKDCSRIDHRSPGCVLVPYQDTLKEMSQASKGKMRTAEHTLQDFYQEACAYGSKLSSCVAIMEIALDTIKKEQSQLPSVLNHCKKLEQDISDMSVRSVPSSVEDAVSYLKAIEKVTGGIQHWASNASTTILKVDLVFRLSKVCIIQAFLFDNKG